MTDIAAYDKGKDSYLYGEKVLSRLELLEAFGVRQDVAREYAHMLNEAHQIALGKEPSANDLHAWLLTFMSHERRLPDFVFTAYAQRRH